MSWFRVDDKSAFHRKVLRAGNQAWGALCRAGAVSSGEETDGRITRETMIAIEPNAKVWKRLEDAGLVERIDGSEDYQIHDYLQWNMSAEQVEAERQRKRKNIDSFRARNRVGAPPVTAPVTAPVTGYKTGSRLDTNHGPSHPIPSHPDQIRSDTCVLLSQPGNSDRGAEPDAHTSVGEILGGLRSHQALAAVATVAVAEMLDGRRLASSASVPEVLKAIGEAASDTPGGETAQAIQKRLRTYCDRARDRRTKAGPFPRYQNDRVQRDQGPQAWKSATPIRADGTEDPSATLDDL